MFKEHPKGLAVLFFTEMWERFGLYTLFALFTLYLSERFGWDETTIGNVYGSFLGAVYFSPLLGGWIADNFLGYSKTIVTGAVIMIIGYATMAIPTSNTAILFTALGIIALGSGLFKANISVLVGNLYKKEQGSLKDAAFNIFYMGINIGAFLAPMGAREIKDYFVSSYHVSLAEGYNAGFGLAAVGMLISVIIFLTFRKHYIYADYNANSATVKEEVQLTKKEFKDRVIALLTVFFIVIFFWMAFFQNGFTLTLFARDFTQQYVGRFTFVLFDTIGLLSAICFLLGAYLAFRKTTETKYRIAGAIVSVIALAITIIKLNSFSDTNRINPESFQIFNPMFIVFFTPVIVGFFGYLNKKGKEPSSATKIALGMLAAACAFGIMTIAAFKYGNGGASPYWLISTYFGITVAELFLSPIGLSLVSKVAPSKIKGLMMGGWFAATAIGVYLSGFMGRFYDKQEPWRFFVVIVGINLLLSFITFLLIKKLKKTI